MEESSGCQASSTLSHSAALVEVAKHNRHSIHNTPKQDLSDGPLIKVSWTKASRQRPQYTSLLYVFIASLSKSGGQKEL